MRLLHHGVQLSKEVLRLYYRPTAWAQSLAEAQNIARQNGQEDWQDVCKNKLKQKPDPLKDDMKQLVNQLYGVIANQLLDHQAFPNHPDIESYTSALKETLSRYTKGQVHA